MTIDLTMRARGFTKKLDDFVRRYFWASVIRSHNIGWLIEQKTLTSSLNWLRANNFLLFLLLLHLLYHFGYVGYDLGLLIDLRYVGSTAHEGSALVLAVVVVVRVILVFLRLLKSIYIQRWVILVAYYLIQNLYSFYHLSHLINSFRWDSFTLLN